MISSIARRIRGLQEEFSSPRFSSVSVPIVLAASVSRSAKDPPAMHKLVKYPGKFLENSLYLLKTFILKKNTQTSRLNRSHFEKLC